MQTVTHNGIEYTERELRDAWYEGEISHQDYMNLWNHMRLMKEKEYIQSEYEFTDEQMALFTDKQLKAIIESYEAWNEIDDLKYRVNQFESWIEDRPYD